MTRFPRGHSRRGARAPVPTASAVGPGIRRTWARGGGSKDKQAPEQVLQCPHLPSHLPASNLEDVGTGEGPAHVTSEPPEHMGLGRGPAGGRGETLHHRRPADQRPRAVLVAHLPAEPAGTRPLAEGPTHPSRHHVRPGQQHSGGCGQDHQHRGAERRGRSCARLQMSLALPSA